jgi:hypothetical protein
VYTAACKVGVNFAAHKEVTAFQGKATLTMQPYKSTEWYECVHVLFMQAIGTHTSSEAGPLPTPSPTVHSPSPTAHSPSLEAGQSTALPESVESPAVRVDSEAVAAIAEPVRVIFHSSVPLFC